MEPDIARYDQTMVWIRAWFNVLPLDEALARLASGTLPARAAVITFDDGYADNLLQAVPILKRHGLHATFFIATGFLDGGIMWNDRIIEAAPATPVPQRSVSGPQSQTLAIATSAEKLIAINLAPIWAIKHLPPEQRQEMVDSVVDACGVTLPSDLMLTSEQLVKLRDSGMGIGHTPSTIRFSPSSNAMWHLGKSATVAIISNLFCNNVSFSSPTRMENMEPITTKTIPVSCAPLDFQQH